jgi:hypothetical protein
MLDFPQGFGIGGDISKFRFFVNNILEKCSATDVCETYEAGVLLPPDPDGWQEAYLDTVEVWGTGGERIIEHGLMTQEKYLREKEEKSSSYQQQRANRSMRSRAEIFLNEFNQQMFFTKSSSYQQHDDYPPRDSDSTDRAHSV